MNSLYLEAHARKAAPKRDTTRAEIRRLWAIRRAAQLVFFMAMMDVCPGLARGQESSSQEQAADTTNFLGLEAGPIDEPMVTDRPDFTESAVVVPIGRLQLEAGYTYTHDDENGVRTGEHTFPEVLLRAGLARDWELRVAWQGWSLTESLYRAPNDAGRRVNVKEHDDGGADMSIGFKRHLREQRGWVPELGLIGEMTLPTGAEGKTSGDVDPGVKFLWAYELTERMSLSGNLNFAVPTSEKGRFFQTASSVSLGYAWTDWLGSYVEYFGTYPNDRGSDCAHTLNGGFTFPITDNLQFDVRAGVGLNEEADDLFVGTGLAIRF